jgi:hypothetical protein
VVVKMAKFARYELGKTEPLEIYEGDFMQCEGAYVKIFAGDEVISEGQSLNPPHLLCAIRLSGGQRIAEMKVATNPEASNVVPQTLPDVKPQEPLRRRRQAQRKI